MKHPTCETCNHAGDSANKCRPWMRSCAISNDEWHKDDYCSRHSEPIPDFEALLKAERSKVVQEVREWAKSNSETNCDFGGECDGTSSVDYQSLLIKLDSMADKEAENV